MLPGRNIVSGADTHVPPDSLGFGAILRDHHFKRTFAVIAGLFPGPLPAPVFEAGGGELSPLPGVRSVAVRVQSGYVFLIVFDFSDFPFAAQVRAIRPGRLIVCHATHYGAGVGQGDVTPDVLAGLDDARRAGVHVVRASRVPGGTVIANGAIRDDEHDFVAADTLNPQKARVLLMLALTATDDRREIQRIFDQY